MGKPLSRPDCLRQNPPCVGKGDEEEDINIEDCYVPQRSIYDTVRLNEQIDSGSKGSLSSRHFSDRTLPYSHRTLDLSTLCSNGALSSSSVFELRGRETNKLDEKMIFDALKLNNDVIRTAGMSKAKYHTEKKEHRRSWRMLVLPHFADSANKSESSVAGTFEMAGLAATNQDKYGANSLTSEDDDSGLCSPQTEREEKQIGLPGQQNLIRSLSSIEDIQLIGRFGTFSSPVSSSEHNISRSSLVNGPNQGKLQDTLHKKHRGGDLLWNLEGHQEGGDGPCNPVTSSQKDILAHAERLQESEREYDITVDIVDRKEVKDSSEINEPLENHDRKIEKDFLDISPQDMDIYYEDAAIHVGEEEIVKHKNVHKTEHNMIHKDPNEIQFSAQALEVENTSCHQANPVRTDFSFRVADIPIEETLDTVYNGVRSNKVTQNIEHIFEYCYGLFYYLGFASVIAL
ncbi:microtubule-actin cross-linking factor 1, isoforms 6/7-like [Candoia aspera]|uniref:microtubule-actin cross-linking factor 1, isoforms 6/7-like n=1 Tax=Candoia aspera TaxID=51853 RepID=UPI002FD840BC